MPRAPQTQQQIQPAALPGVRVSAAGTPESYGAQAGQTVARVGAALYDREVYAADHAAVMDAEAKASDQQLRILQDMRQYRGQQAATVPDYALQDFDKSIGEIQKGLSNDRQRGLFHAVMQGRRQGLQRSAIAYANQETDKFQQEAFDADIAKSTDLARANAGDPFQVGLEKGNQKALIRQQAIRLGYADTEIEKNQLAQVHSRTNTEVIKGLLANGQDIKAQQYYDNMLKFEGDQNRVDEKTGEVTKISASVQFTAQDRDAVKGMLEEGSTRGTAQRLLRGWLADGKTEGEMYAEADKHDNPKVVDLAHSLVSRHFREQAAIQKDQADNNYLQATNLVDQAYKQNPTGPIEPRMLVDPDKWATFTIGERNALEARANALTKYDKPDRPNDDKLWLDFLALKPEEVAKLSRRDFDQQYWQHFDNHTRQRAETQWNTYKDALAKKDDKTAEMKITPTLTFKDQVNNAWALSGLIDPAKERSKWNTDEMKQFVRFENDAAQAVQQYEMTKLEGKRHATPDEVRDIIKGVRDNAVKKVFTEGFFFNTEKPVIGLEEDEKKNVFVPLDKIPVDSLDDLRRYIQSLGKTVTADKLRRAYAQRILNNRAAFEAIVNE